MEVNDYKCLSCGANLHFNPTTQKWHCDYCNEEYELDALEKYYGKDENLKEEKEIEIDTEWSSYNCPNCGAEIIADETTTATFCVYCGSSTVIKNKMKGEFNPSKVIPFKKTKQDAINAFKSCTQGKLFAPDEFTNPINIEKISGVYIPFFIYDCDMNSSAVIDGTKIKTWSDSSYNYKKIDYYKIERAATMHFENIPVDGATKFPDDIMNSIEPFDYKGFKDFSPSYLTGFLSERYDLTLDELFEIARERASVSTESVLLDSAKGYSTKNISERKHEISKNNSSEYVLLPVWMLNIKFNGEMHTFAMNGQTGKFIGNIPVDKKKFWKWWRKLFFGSFAITALITILCNMF